jgi:hypothetical protein
MALQASGPISFSQIANEFGLPPGRNLGAYRISETIGELNRPLDDGIPISGTIQFGNFYSKRLNIVVYCSGNRVVARDLYNANQSTFVIGQFTSRPGSSSGKKVWIYTNEAIGSNIPASWSPNNLYCSLITGGFDADTDLRLDIGPGGFVSGAGGDGGGGGSVQCNGGGNGNFGTSAIGVNYQPIIITNRGNIWGGSGGGGGGGAAYGENRRSFGRDSRIYTAGGGGGGGSGIPGGAGGGPGGGTKSDRGNISVSPSPGGAGGATFQGGGGGGASGSGRGASAVGGTGGNGGAGGAAGSGFGNSASCSAAGGSPGANGYGIIITNDGTGVSISGNARIGGDVINTPIS